MGRIADVPTAGLGLAICSAIVEQHAGTIRIDEPPGGGTRVTIDLPRAA
jgi:signal transduction histidine kinase